MNDFGGRTAVVTGAGSGIGRALALEAAARDMRLVLADVNEDDLAAVADELKSAAPLTLVTDVSDDGAVARLAEHTRERVGKVHLLFNNAGVSSAPRPLWESSLDDWRWVTGVNLMGVVHGVRAFVPDMLAHGEAAHIVNTASIAGLISNSRLNAYGVSKHAVVALSETLYLDLKEAGARVGVSVLCPAWVKTRIHLSARNRPRPDDAPLGPGERGVAGKVADLVEGGLEPSEVARAVFEAVESERFYILTHPDFSGLVQRRLNAIVGGGNPKASW